MSEMEIDLNRQIEAKKYSRIRYRLMAVDILIGGLYTIAWLNFGWSQQLKEWLSGFTSSDWLLVAGFGILFGGIYYLLTLPLSFYEGFLLPHRFSMSNQSRSEWATDQAKALAIGVFLGGLLLEIIYATLRAAPHTWWIWAGLILLVFNVILANLAPVILFPIFYKFVPLEDEFEELADRLIRLAKEANTYVQGVFKFDMSRRTNAANAALTGLGNTRRIILGDTLLEKFTNDEIETVLAHELGHHVHKDIPKGIVIESFLTLGGLYLAARALEWGTQYYSFESPADIASLPLFILVMGIFSLFLMPLTNAYSRWREVKADQYALTSTRMGDAYASALVRLANQNLAVVEPEPWVVFLLHSHPPLNKRIEMAKNFAMQN